MRPYDVLLRNKFNGFEFHFYTPETKHSDNARRLAEFTYPGCTVVKITPIW